MRKSLTLITLAIAIGATAGLINARNDVEAERKARHYEQQGNFAVMCEAGVVYLDPQYIEFVDYACLDIKHRFPPGTFKQ